MGEMQGRCRRDIREISARFEPRGRALILWGALEEGRPRPLARLGRCGRDMGEIWARYGRDAGEMQGRYRGDTRGGSPSPSRAAARPRGDVGPYVSPVSPLYLAYISRASRLRAVLAQLLPRPLERVETRLRDMGEIWARYTRDRWEI